MRYRKSDHTMQGHTCWGKVCHTSLSPFHYFSINDCIDWTVGQGFCKVATIRGHFFQHQKWPITLSPPKRHSMLSYILKNPNSKSKSYIVDNVVSFHKLLGRDDKKTTELNPDSRWKCENPLSNLNKPFGQHCSLPGRNLLAIFYFEALYETIILSCCWYACWSLNFFPTSLKGQKESTWTANLLVLGHSLIGNPFYRVLLLYPGDWR